LSVASDIHPLCSFHFLTPFPGSFCPIGSLSFFLHLRHKSTFFPGVFLHFITDADNPNIEQLGKLAEFYNVSIDYFLGNTPQKYKEWRFKKMKLMEITKNGERLSVVHGDDDITTPIKIEFVLDEKNYNKLKQATKYYKWNIYDALFTFCEFSERFIGEVEFNFNEFSNPED